jgi:hypothetical protein
VVCEKEVVDIEMYGIGEGQSRVRCASQHHVLHNTVGEIAVKS